MLNFLATQTHYMYLSSCFGAVPLFTYSGQLVLSIAHTRTISTCGFRNSKLQFYHLSELNSSVTFTFCDHLDLQFGLKPFLYARYFHHGVSLLQLVHIFTKPYVGYLEAYYCMIIQLLSNVDLPFLNDVFICSLRPRRLSLCYTCVNGRKMNALKQRSC